MSDGNDKKPSTSRSLTQRANVPAQVPPRAMAALDAVKKLEITKGLPPATIIYGGASGVLFAISLCFLVTGHFINGLLVMLPAFCFLGFAVHLLKHGQ